MDKSVDGYGAKIEESEAMRVAKALFVASK
jgi:hypothetical protein